MTQDHPETPRTAGLDVLIRATRFDNGQCRSCNWSADFPSDPKGIDGHGRNCAYAAAIRWAEAAARQVTELRAAAREVWASVPASYDYDDPMVQRHAKALNALGRLVEEYAPFAAAGRLLAGDKAEAPLNE